MTATVPVPASTPSPSPSRVLDVSATPSTPVTRLVRVELRKTVDTRSGRWLLITIGAITAAVMVIMLFAIEDVTFLTFSAGAGTPQTILLPALGILLVTSEWGQRTAMATFALEPSRPKVLAAKTLAATLWSLVAYVLAISLTTVFTLISGNPDGFDDLNALFFAVILLLQVVTILQGVGYGMALLNTPAALAAFFILPIVFNIPFTLVEQLDDIAPWVDIGTAQEALFSIDEGDFSLAGKEWARLGTTTLIWIVVPFLAGWFRVTRAEVK